MGYFSTQEKIVGICKEGTRGTESVTAPSYIPVETSSNIDYKLTLIEDAKMRGIPEPVQPLAGMKDATGTITCDAEPELIGEFLASLMGTDTIGVAANGVYPHVFTKKPFGAAATNPLLHQSYTLHFQRGDDTNITHLAYLRSVVKSITFTGSGTDKLSLASNFISETEANSTLASAGVRFAPTWVAPAPFMFNEATTITLGGSTTTDIRDLSLTIDNLALGLRTLRGSQDIADIICPGKLLISGGFTILFTSMTERAKFMANTASSLTVLYTRGATTTLRSLTIAMPQIHYKAFPFGESDGLVAAAVTFDAYYNLPSTTAITITLRNLVATSYTA